MTISLTELRKTSRYRLFEGVLAFTTFGFFLIIFFLSFFTPEIAAVIILLYSFAWLLRVSMINIYTIFTFKNLLRWKTVHPWIWLKNMGKNLEKTKSQMIEFRDKHAKKINHAADLNALIAQIDVNRGTKFEDPTEIWQMPIFAVYNEDSNVIAKSLRAIYDSHYDRSKIVVFLSQEQRYDAVLNAELRKQLADLPWLSVHEAPVIPIDTVYSSDHTALEYVNTDLNNIQLDKNRLNIICTAHPDGLPGEIIGKASNEDWAGRIISLFTKSRGIDPELCLVTSLDADSSVSDDYFALLTLRYVLTPKDHGRFGFQSIPTYTKNIFETTLIPRMVAFQTTLWTMAQNGLEGKTHFFANYSVPLIVLQEVDFWDREHIAEDYLFYARCFMKYKGDFRVLPFYGMFNGDAIIGDDVTHALENQYKQHQRWSWGGVESVAYLLQRFFVEKNSIPLGKRISEFTSVFLNHHFWATAPLLFTVGIVLPAFFGGVGFQDSLIASNLRVISSYFAVISYVFILIFAFISYHLMQRTVDVVKASSLEQTRMVFLQALVSPLAYGLMAIPAINAQTRGLLGKYLGYWVTPKK